MLIRVTLMTTTVPWGAVEGGPKYREAGSNRHDLPTSQIGPWKFRVVEGRRLGSLGQSGSDEGGER